MSDRLYVGTRKGLFELAPRNGAWDIADVRFLGEPVRDRTGLSDPVADDDEIYIFQALTGG
jgi:molybdopterin converting factor small subunit